jgi:hypothetical protein
MGINNDDFISAIDFYGIDADVIAGGDGQDKRYANAGNTVTGCAGRFLQVLLRSLQPPLWLPFSPAWHMKVQEQ